MVAGEEISIRIDHTLTHDVTGTPAYLAFETLGIPQVKTERSVSYIDHNMLYTDNKNPDDHIYLQTVAKNTAFIYPKPETVFAIRCTSNALAVRGLRCWVPIATRQPAARLAPWRLAQAGWTSRWRWRASRPAENAASD